MFDDEVGGLGKRGIQIEMTCMHRRRSRVATRHDGMASEKKRSVVVMVTRLRLERKSS